ncbi:flad-1 [Pristionchus pacificus]|uniref:FAD synthase n=1 Tax=Pristionchus pacificus TaxID=54126 RepID=A0A2A6B5Y6_PRIPA|nr:flad-1 [Pristionchus pacificus]|eukprot:PDM61294.1 flad-1 [Pristionchus pacificus]
MGEDAGRKSQRQFAELVQKTIVESHSFPPGHGFPGYKPFTSVLKELRYREMGDKRMRLDKIWPSLMKSENREFQQSHELKVRGEAMLDSRRAVSSAGVIDLEEEVMRGFVHDRAQFDGHSVKFILSVDTDALARNNAHIGTNVHMKRIMEKYVILMTNLGQIRMYVEEDNNYVLTHRFNLPAHLFNFKELSWNVERDEFYALGVSPRMHIDEIEDSQFSHTSRRSNSNPFTRSHALAVISVHPIVVAKYLVRLDPEVINSIKLVPGNMLMIVITYNADMAQIEFNPAPYVYIPIAIFIDATTGILVKDTVQMGLGGFFSMARSDGDAKIVRIDRLVEREPPKEISVVGDGIDEISDEVLSFSSRFDLVFTTGGIGPTHDDNTFNGLAKAFGDELYLCDDIVLAIHAILPDKLKSTQDSPKRKRSNSYVSKLATIPRSSTLLWGQRDGNRSTFPVVKVKNVIAFPGVPQFCRRAFVDLENELFPSSSIERQFSHILYSSKTEFSFSDRLSAVAKMFEENVEIGSYPVLENNYFSTKLTIDSESIEEGEKAVMELKNIIGDNLVIYDDFPHVNTVEKWNSLRDRLKDDPNGGVFLVKLDRAMEIVDKQLDEYSLDEIALSFNGGKDCTVLLHLLRIAIDKKYGAKTKMFGFHIMVEDQFPEMSQFIIDVSSTYAIDVIEYSGPLKEGLISLQKDRPSTVAVLMGSRSSDPKGKYMKSPVEWTDRDWPRLLRVCPILEWSYSDVWKFLRALCVPYCKLYDEGFTSLGGRTTTRRNDALRIVNERTNEVKYLPAFKLKEDDLERHGRELSTDEIKSSI